MRMPTLMAGLLVAAAGCGEYGFNALPDDAEEVETLDTGVPAPEPEVTVDTGTDTGVATQDPVEDTEEPPPPPPGVADAPVYANDAGSLYEVVPATGDAVYIGAMHDDLGEVVNFVDIAIDLDGHLYGGTFDSLYKIDPATGFVEYLCTPGVDMTALTFTSSGHLAAGGDSDLVWIDVDTCALSDLVVGAPYATSGDLVGLPDGYLYWTVEGDDERDELVRVDPYTGGMEWLGVAGVDQLFGLGFHEGSLYGFSDDGETVRIDPSDGTTEILGVSSTIQWWGATTNPVTW